MAARVHLVVSGDTLSGIAALYLGDPLRWPELAAHNRVYHPDLILVGQRIEIPADQTHSAATASLAAESEGPAGAGLHLALPRGWFVSSRFGMREWPGVPPHLHLGHDLAGMPIGTPIRLTAAAQVYLSGNNAGGYGYYVVLKLAEERWLFGHLAQPAPAVGAQLAPGETIGLVGSTGFSTGPHIHLECWSPGAADWAGHRDPEGLYRVSDA